MGAFSSAIESNDDPQLVELYNYHALARSLQAGTISRPALPLELVIYILRLAHCVAPSYSRVVEPEETLTVSSSGPLQTKLWFSTPPFTRKELTKIAEVMLVTLSKDQGHVSDPNRGCWSWFELAIIPGADTDTENVKPKETSDGLPLSWKSHENPLAARELRECYGQTFGPEHEIWSHLAEGDAIAVFGCAQFPGWQCYGEEARLQFWEFFEPTLPLRLPVESQTESP